MKNIEAIKTLIESMGITQEELYPIPTPQQPDVEDKNWEIVAFKSVENEELMKLHTNGCYEYENLKKQDKILFSNNKKMKKKNKFYKN